MAKALLRKVNISKNDTPTERQMAERLNNGADKYVESYHCKKIHEIMGKGKSVAQICKIFKITPATLYNWLKIHPKFKEAYDYAIACAQAWWENKIMDIIDGKITSANATKMITFVLEKRFRQTYGDNKSYHIITEQKFTELSDDELDNRIKQRINEIKHRDFTGKNVIEAEFIDNERARAEDRAA